LLRAHEDKSYPGAFIASLAIPWGEAVGDEDQGGYHLVWTRDMVNSATAMLAAGDRITPLRALIYLDVSQLKNGGFAQNFWIDGFPVLLAWRLGRENALQDFDPYPMVLRAAAYLVRHGPVTPQERWEEVSGYSPSTLASNIAALICAAGFAREKGDEATAKYLEEYVDFLECHVESWTVTTEGTLLPGGREALLADSSGAGRQSRPSGRSEPGKHHHCEPSARRTECLSSQGNRGCRFS
jgi:glucoamylase